MLSTCIFPLSVPMYNHLSCSSRQMSVTLSLDICKLCMHSGVFFLKSHKAIELSVVATKIRPVFTTKIIWKMAHSFSCLNSTSTPGLPYNLTTPDRLPMAMIFCSGSKAKAVGLLGKPCLSVNSAVNCSGIRDSMMSCSSLAGPEAPVAPLFAEADPEVGEGEFTLCL